MTAISLPRVLLIDDDDLTTVVLRFYLTSRHVKVDVAASEREARERLERESYQFIISDLRLAGKREETLLHLLEAIRDRDPNVPIMVLSTLGSPEAEKAAVALPVDYFFHKPQPWSQIAALVAERVRGSR